MKRRFLLILIVPLYLLGVVYLLLPSPSVLPLKDALKSDEPGDTWQNPDQSAYFTDLDRETVINYYRDSFSLKLGSLTLKPLRFNYRPEDTAIYVRKYIDSYYLEELVFPLRESLFINGWNPSLAPQTQNIAESERAKAMIHINGQPFAAKITLKPYYSSVWVRLLIWTLIFPVSFLVFASATKIIKSFIKNIH